jgi:predicted RNA polymerase sigma factor
MADAFGSQPHCLSAMPITHRLAGIERDRSCEESGVVESEEEKHAMPMSDRSPDSPEDIRDDTLRRIFTGCYPALSLDAQVALALHKLGGLPTAEVARALMVSEATMAKRLTRAKKRMRTLAFRTGFLLPRNCLTGLPAWRPPCTSSSTKVTPPPRART